MILQNHRGFLSIFTTKDSNDEQNIQLLDGQQRITTIQIVL